MSRDIYVTSFVSHLCTLGWERLIIAFMVAKTKDEQIDQVAVLAQDLPWHIRSIQGLQRAGPEKHGPENDSELQALNVKAYEARLAMHRSLKERAELCLRRLEKK